MTPNRERVRDEPNLPVVLPSSVAFEHEITNFQSCLETVVFVHKAQ